MKSLFLISLLVGILALSLGQVFAADYKVITSIPGTNITAGTSARNFSFASFVEQIYLAALGIVGFIAFVAIVYHGLRYATSAGNQSKVSDAREGITQVILGIILLLSAYLILRTINPRLVELQDPGAGQVPASQIGATNSNNTNNASNCKQSGCAAGNICVPKKTCTGIFFGDCTTNFACEPLPAGCTAGNDPANGKHVCGGAMRCKEEVTCSQFCLRWTGRGSCTFDPNGSN